VGGEEAVLGHDGRVQGKLRSPVGDEVQIRHFLDILSEKLEETSVVHSMVVVMPGMDVQGMLRHGPGPHVQNIGKSLPGGGVKRLVHVGDALATGEVRRPEAHHAHSGRHRCGGMLTLGLEEEEPSAIGVGVARSHGQGPPLAHLGRRRDGIGTRRFAGIGLTPDDGLTAVHGFGGSRVFKGLRSLVALRADHPASLPASSRTEVN